MTTPTTYDTALIMLVHGESGAGKTPIGMTTPTPRLVSDAENGTRFVRTRKVFWNPLTEAPPAADGSWDTCVVQTRDFETLKKTYEWLNSGKHPFVSWTLDSLTEIQKRCKDYLRKSPVFSEQQWGFLLDEMEQIVRDARDLTMHPNQPLQSVVILALTDQVKGKFRPLVQGRLAMNLPGYVDIVGYLYTEQTEAGIERRLLIQPTPEFVAKDRTSALPNGGVIGHYGPVLAGPIDVDRLLAVVNS